MERLLVVRSHQYEQTIKKGLHRCLEKAEKALKALTPDRSRGKRQIKDEASLLAAIQRIEEKYRAAGLFDYHFEQEVSERQVRAYGDKPARTERRIRFQLTVEREPEAIAAAEFRHRMAPLCHQRTRRTAAAGPGCTGLPGPVHRRERLPPFAGQDPLHHPGLCTA